MLKRTLLLPILCFLCICACVKPYTPTVITTNSNYLVVEGFINISDSTFVHLSRTVTITAKSTVKPELKATVTIESNTGTSYAVKEIGNGLYATPSLGLSATNQYRLRIKTSTGVTYLSDFNATVPSPAIDSVSWKAADNLSLYVSTHDPKNVTHYYRWDYSEEWEFVSTFQSAYVSNGGAIVPRTQAQMVYHCYGGDTSQLITLGSSAKLTEDVINQQLLNTVASSAERLQTQYSISVKQYGLTKDAYDYWTLLQKNTQQLGSIFDSQPSSSIGNIHNVANASEVVIGYISAGTITSKRIFITRAQLPASWQTLFPYKAQCQLDTVPYVIYDKNGTPVEYPQNEYINFKSVQYLGDKFRLIPIMPVGKANPVDYQASSPLCVDCTLRGSANKPSYWP